MWAVFGLHVSSLAVPGIMSVLSYLSSLSGHMCGVSAEHETVSLDKQRDEMMKRRDVYAC